MSGSQQIEDLVELIRQGLVPESALEDLYQENEANNASYYRSRQYKGDSELQERDIAHQKLWEELAGTHYVDPQDPNVPVELYGGDDPLEKFKPKTSSPEPKKGSSVSDMVDYLSMTALSAAAITAASLTSWLKTAWTKKSEVNRNLLPSNPSALNSDSLVKEELSDLTDPRKEIVDLSRLATAYHNTLEAAKEKLASYERTQREYESEIDHLQKMKTGSPDTTFAEKQALNRQITAAEEKLATLKLAQDKAARNFALLTSKGKIPEPRQIIPREENGNWETDSVDLDFGLPPRDPRDPSWLTSLPVPSSDKFLEPALPFQFDGKFYMFAKWVTEMSLFVQGAKNRFRSSLDVFNLFLSRTTEKSLAKEFLSNLGELIRTPGTIENAEFLALETATQCAQWVLDKMAGTFTDRLRTTRALREITELKQGNGTFGSFSMKMETLRIQLGWSTQQTRSYMFMAVSPQLRHDLARRVFKSTEDLTYEDFMQYGVECDSDLRSLVPRSVPARAASAVKPQENVRSSDPVPMSHNNSRMPGERELPATCRPHTDREGCPAHLRGALGSWESAGRTAKIAGLRELNRCFICRGIYNRTANPVTGSPAPARPSNPGHPDWSFRSPGPALNPPARSVTSENDPVTDLHSKVTTMSGARNAVAFVPAKTKED
jgi:hypothetical protein